MPRTLFRRIRATYELQAPDRSAALAQARRLVVEQTVEVPERTIPPASRPLVGRIHAVRPAGYRRWQVIASYPAAAVGRSTSQLFNLVFGNVSLLRGVRLVDLGLPVALLRHFPGPRFGLAGIRRLCAAWRRPLVCAAAKPMGLSAAQLAERCRAFALGGADLVKDDHSLADQPAAPFRERVARCLDAVAEANAKTGGHTLYCANLWRAGPEGWEDIEYLRDLGCPGALASPLLLGPDFVRSIAARHRLVLLSHPSFSGSLLNPRHGIAPGVLFGTLFRLIGSDGVVFPGAGGRFPISRQTSREVHRKLREPLGRLPAACPVVGGGVAADAIGHWIRYYGPDTMFLVGSSLYAASDLRQATARLMEAIRRWSDG
jgi:ribulose-bisphosphate carboxylase large chain